MATCDLLAAIESAAASFSGISIIHCCENSNIFKAGAPIRAGDIRNNFEANVLYLSWHMVEVGVPSCVCHGCNICRLRGPWSDVTPSLFIQRI
jgi:hypothetical protein